MKSKWLKYRFIYFFLSSFSKFFFSFLLFFFVFFRWLFGSELGEEKKNKKASSKRKELLCRLLPYLNAKFQSIEQTNWFVSDFCSSLLVLVSFLSFSFCQHKRSQSRSLFLSFSLSFSLCLLRLFSGHRSRLCWIVLVCPIRFPHRFETWTMVLLGI